MKFVTFLATGIVVLLVSACGGGGSTVISQSSDQKFNAENHVWDFVGTGPYAEWVCLFKRTTGQVPSDRCAGVSKVDTYPNNGSVANPDYPPLSTVWPGMPIDVLCAVPMRKLREKYPADYAVEYSTSTVADTLYDYNFGMGRDYYRNHYLDSEFVRENGTDRIAIIWSRPPVMIPTKYWLTVNGVTEEHVLYTERTDRIIWVIQRRTFPREWLDCSSWGRITTVDGTNVTDNSWNWSYR